MTRVLVIVAVAGLLMSVACISAAVAIGGPEAMKRGDWAWTWMGPHHWGRMHEAAGPPARRDFPFSGGFLEVNAPAEVDYVQAPGPAKLTISGPAQALDRVRVEGGRITLAGGFGGWDGLRVSLTAPAVTRFAMHGADRLAIRGYRQDQLAIEVAGHADVSAEGETKTVRLDLTGAGDADFSALKTAGADIDISGAGDATVGPTDWARVRISGVGDVNLLTRPPQLETQIAGAGHVRLPDAGVTSGAGRTGAAYKDDDDRSPPRRA